MGNAVELYASLSSESLTKGEKVTITYGADEREISGTVESNNSTEVLLATNDGTVKVAHESVCYIEES